MLDILQCSCLRICLSLHIWLLWFISYYCWCDIWFFYFILIPICLSFNSTHPEILHSIISLVFNQTFVNSRQWDTIFSFLGLFGPIVSIYQNDTLNLKQKPAIHLYELVTMVLTKKVICIWNLSPEISLCNMVKNINKSQMQITWCVLYSILFWIFDHRILPWCMLRLP